MSMTVGQLTLVEFLLARVAEDEADARRAQAAADGHLWVVTGMDNAVGVDYDPVRVLAECQARRAIIELHEHVGAWMSEWQDGDPVPFESGEFGCRICALDDRQIEPEGWCATLRALAGPFKGHPDFDPAWLPK